MVEATKYIVEVQQEKKWVPSFYTDDYNQAVRFADGIGEIHGVGTARIVDTGEEMRRWLEELNLPEGEAVG